MRSLRRLGRCFRLPSSTRLFIARSPPQLLRRVAFAGDLPGFPRFDQQHTDGAGFRGGTGVEQRGVVS
jgi:hypothetical protein